MDNFAVGKVVVVITITSFSVLVVVHWFMFSVFWIFAKPTCYEYRAAI